MTAKSCNPQKSHSLSETRRKDLLSPVPSEPAPEKKKSRSFASKRRKNSKFSPRSIRPACRRVHRAGNSLEVQYPAVFNHRGHPSAPLRAGSGHRGKESEQSPALFSSASGACPERSRRMSSARTYELRLPAMSQADHEFPERAPLRAPPAGPFRLQTVNCKLQTSFRGQE